ncbi:MAG TPA: DUF192 domain-containing protein [Candidatus Limnocylindria bacterium]|jgi:uncharacterized membrane protein (UPF0127 family)|nr:DUF192 domain-containing protein [Candidatus Limnocylindria bacterium]
MAVLKNVSTGAIVATRVERATRFVERMVGLMARPRIRPDEGIWIEDCGGIHTIGMRSSIDVIFIDGEARVVRVHMNVAPFTLALVCRKAHAVIELGAGALEHQDILVGDHLELR